MEHATDGVHFARLGVVAGQGNSNQLSAYDFVHTDAPAGRNTYRLRQVDYDGAYSYSQQVEVRIEAPQQVLAVSPNPATGGRVRCVYEATGRGPVELTLCDLAGRRLQTGQHEVWQAGRQEMELVAPATYRGLCILQVRQQRQVHHAMVWLE
ncbi:MAG: hypothetical protein OHK0039_38610 [Bacteroidia bacterium]